MPPSPRSMQPVSKLHRRDRRDGVRTWLQLLYFCAHQFSAATIGIDWNLTFEDRKLQATTGLHDQAAVGT